MRSLSLPLQRPTRVVIFDRFKDMGFTVATAKVEYGGFKNGDRLIMMPNRTVCEVVGIFVDSVEYAHAEPGDNVRIRLKGIEVSAFFLPCPLFLAFFSLNATPTLSLPLLMSPARGHSLWVHAVRPHRRVRVRRRV